mmetsp:Transcript_46284/g.122848  ORF Transcript_46284/g.122848 Transcript_46284/m.122848 type:complete len:203 (-) Transcript_46284:592-1200(-)
MSCNETERQLSVALQIFKQTSELLRVDQGLGLVCPLSFRQGLRQLVRDDTVEHEVVKTVWQLLTHDRLKVIRHGGIVQRPDNVVLHVHHGRILHKYLAYAITVNVVVLHLLRRERLHPVDQRSLFDDVHCGIKVETARRHRLKVSQIQIGVGQAVLCASQHASINEHVPGDLPLLKHGSEVHPIEDAFLKIYVNNHPLHAVQ